MSETWQRIGRVAGGGSVLSMCAGANDQTWLATGGGILSGALDAWAPLPEPMPAGQAGLVGAAGSDWWVAGLSGGLILTWDAGRSWASAWIDQADEPITCFAASPRYERDKTLLVGTAGSGVLRSTDGGRRWQMSSFGLEEFTVLALATAGDWSRRQVVFAGTADGVYRSVGGGRAWKSVGLKGATVQSLAAGKKPRAGSAFDAPDEGLPDASGAWTILAGTEADGLYLARDGGFAWSRCGREIGPQAGINALLCPQAGDEGVWLAGTDDGGIWRSADDGATWRQVCAVAGPVLALAEGHGALLAGTSESGLWVSRDLGLSWRPDETLSAWGFRRLYVTGGDGLVALAPAGGVWRSTDEGHSWERVLEASLYEPVLACEIVGSAWLAARADGVWRGSAETEPVLVLEAGEAPITALALPPEQGAVWAGAADGALWASGDDGRSWQMIDVPFRGQRLLGLSFSPADGTLLVGTFSAEGNETTLWRRLNERWQRWLSRSDTWAGLALAADGARGEESWAALGGKPYAHDTAGWHEIQTEGCESQVAVISRVAANGSRYLICSSRIMVRDGGGQWQSLSLPEASPGPVDLCLLSSGAVVCLDAIGAVWRLGA